MRACWVLSALAWAAPAFAEIPDRFTPAIGPAWETHYIDGAAPGADGLSAADINGDGRPDLAVVPEGNGAWIYIHPGYEQVESAWPRLQLTKGGEGVRLADIDGDGRIDLLAGHGSKKWHIYWGTAGDPLFASSWNGPHEVPGGSGGAMWFAVADLDGDSRKDIVAASKAGFLYWLKAPLDPRNLSGWTRSDVYDAIWGWQVDAVDMDEDGDLDLLYVDREAGIMWLANPAWSVNRLDDFTEPLRRAFHFSRGDVDDDGLEDVVVGGVESYHTEPPVPPATKPTEVHTVQPGVDLYRRLDSTGTDWARERIADDFMTVNVGDIDNDGTRDLQVQVQFNFRPKWLRPGSPDWTLHNIDSEAGGKADNALLIDLDGDGDLDVVNTLESGVVVWHENPFSLLPPPTGEGEGGEECP